MTPDPKTPQDLVLHLQTILRNLGTSPYPHLPSPEETKRRASVAFILRIKPFSTHWPQAGEPRAESLESFFEREWAQNGDPEVLFIKRASRKGDRWTSHIALPGGKRDPEDPDDKATAIRETWEEVGLDLDSYAIECGNLPQRIVTTHWGKKPLLVLCPYVFLLTTNEIPPLKLQPTEVAATHWVPLRSLLAPEQRAVVHEDISRQLVNQETGVRKWMAGTILGKMIFAAINLLPSESLYSAESPSAESTLQDNRFLPIASRERLRRFAHRIWTSDIFNQYPLPRPEGPLLLWGLTLGMISDFLDLMPPHNALTLWTYPTFTPLDVRFTIWLFTYRFKNRKRAELQAGTDFQQARPSFGTASESVVYGQDLSSINPSSTATEEGRTDETGFHGLGSGAGVGVIRSKRAAVQTMLEGWVESTARLFLPEITNRARYYDIVRRAVAFALVGRLGVLAVVAVLAWRRLRRN